MRLPLKISDLRGHKSEDCPAGMARVIDADGRFVAAFSDQADAEEMVRGLNKAGQLEAACRGLPPEFRPEVV